jgi:hypothetical protein
MADDLWILLGAMVVMAIVGFAIVFHIDRLDRADRRRMREAEGGNPKTS